VDAPDTSRFATGHAGDRRRYGGCDAAGTAVGSTLHEKFEIKSLKFKIDNQIYTNAYD
jgi:hypothetical protein